MDEYLENNVIDGGAQEMTAEVDSALALACDDTAVDLDTKCASEKRGCPLFEAFINKRKEKKAVAKRIHAVVKSVLILLLAAVMLGFSFLPTVSISSAYGNMEVEVPFSTVDNIEMFILSFYQYSSPTKTEYYKEAERMVDRLESNASIDGITDPGTLMEIYGEDIAEIALLIAKGTIMTADFKATMLDYISSIFSMLYMLFALSFFVFAIINLIRVLCKKEWGRFEWWVNAHLAASPAFAACVACVISLCNVGSGIMSMTAFSLTVLILALAVTAYSVVMRLVLDKTKNARVLIMRCAVAMLAAVVMVGCVVPVFNSIASKVEINMGVATFGKYSAVTEEEAEDFDGTKYGSNEKRAAVKQLYTALDSMSKAGKQSSIGAMVNAELAASMMLYRYGVKGNIHLALLPAIVNAIVILAALVMAHCFMYMISGRECRTAYLAYRISLATLSAAFLVITIIFVLFLNGVSSIYIDADEYSATIGPAAIIAAAASLVAVALPAFKSKAEDDADCDGVLECCGLADGASEAVPYATVSVKAKCCVLGVAEEIKALKELYDMGAITEEEFTAKKTKLLGL